MTASASSIAIDARPEVQYLLRLGDTCLILAQRLGQWCGHAPILEEDIAMTNMALDLVGQARALLTRAGQLEGRAHDEDQLAFLRDERDYFNATLAELPRGDFAFTVLRNAMAATWLRLMWERLVHSSDAELAAIAAKALKEARYHEQHAGDWVVRLGDGTDESHARMQAAFDHLMPYTQEFWTPSDFETAAVAAGIGVDVAGLRPVWRATVEATLQEATLRVSSDQGYVPQGKHGLHSEHLGFLLAEMQCVARAHPGAVW